MKVTIPSENGDTVVYVDTLLDLALLIRNLEEEAGEDEHLGITTDGYGEDIEIELILYWY